MFPVHYDSWNETCFLRLGNSFETFDGTGRTTTRGPHMRHADRGTAPVIL